MFDSALKFRRLLVTGAVTAASLSVVSPVSALPGPGVNLLSAAVVSQTSDPWFDTSDRGAVLGAFHAEFDGDVPDAGWTGNRDTCTPGTTSQEYRDAILRRVNWFRAMAGVPAHITENAQLSALAQESALMMSESGKLSHSPDQSYSCFTSAGSDASGKSNLYLGRTGPDAITGYIEDPGSNNSSAGHRNWILHPTSTQMGTGDIPITDGWAANTLYVIQDPSIVFGPQPELREDGGVISWPPAGYVPNEVVFDRWSVGIRSADFGAASVTVVVDGKPVQANVEHRSSGGNSAPFPIMVWNVPSLASAPAHDVAATVTITNILVGGAATSYTYTTIIIGDAPVTGVFASFVDQAFQDFLGRSATGSELAYWESRLASGTSRLQFVNTLATSEEWTTKVVQNLYLDTLGREADAEGASYWASRLRNGTSVANAASQFYGSSEYVAAEGGTWNAWLVDLYAELMRRSPDAAGLGYWIGQAESRGSGNVAYDFYQSGESRRGRVVELYQRFLGRSPDQAGLEYWSGVLKSGDDLALAAFLASSDEYLVKAG